eukprot:SAG11_NODE_4075_length_2077_cov_36.721941_4_plen_66_part_01
MSGYRKLVSAHLWIEYCEYCSTAVLVVYSDVDQLLMRLGKVGKFFTYRPSLYHFFPTLLVNIARYC